MLQPHDSPDPGFTLTAEQHKSEALYLYYASELIGFFGFENEDEFNAALQRAFDACSAMQLSIDDNFLCVYRYAQNALLRDWKLSSLACYLIAINGNPGNRNVARAQLYFYQP